jgi:hypothetical protein
VGRSPAERYLAARLPEAPYKGSQGVFTESLMRLFVIMAVMAVLTASPAWSKEGQSPQTPKGSVRVNDLPKPIPELLQKLQQLSSKIEPEISRLGSTLGQELNVTVKKLCEELQCQQRSESK